MLQYQSYRGYTLADARFYEDISYFISDGDLERRVRSLASDEVTTDRRGPWIICRPNRVSLARHGWKIHVSTVPDDAARALEIVIEEFARTPFHFKCLRDRRLVVAATSRWWQPGQVGKAIVIYPTSADECRNLLARLEPQLRGIVGPYVLTDRRYGDSSCLYYRYGGFISESKVLHSGVKSAIIRGPDGQEWADDRAPVYQKPPWVEDLFPKPEAKPVSRTLHGYRVIRALNHTGAGGLYLAERVTDGTTVVLKESRPHTAFATDGSSGQVRLRREFDSLTRLHGAGVGPEPIELFQEWEHLFLAQEYFEFSPLTSFVAARSPLAHGDLSPEKLATYRTEMRAVLASLRRAIAECHERGLCYGDMSMTNILVEPETLTVRLVDFESSKPLDQWHGDTPTSPGFRPPAGSAAWSDPRAFDEFGVASVELSMIQPRNIMRDLSPQALVRSTRHAAALLRYPLGDLLERLELPAVEKDEPADVDLMVKETIRFIGNTLTPDRADRLFPAAPDVYISNPWSAAYGAAGLVRGLHRISGQVHPDVRDWMSRHKTALDSVPPGLYFGLAGVGWTLLDSGDAQWGLELIARAATAPLAELPATVAEGGTGVGLACLAAWQRTGDEVWRERATRIGDQLIGSARDSGLGLHWPERDANRHPVGYAYGSSGNSLFLLYLHLATGEQRFLHVARRALDFDLHQIRPRGTRGIGLPGHADRPLLEPYWQRGSAGFGGVLARFCRVTDSPELRATLNRLVYWTLQGTALNVGLFSGMAGIINFALDCHHLLGGADYHDLASGMTEDLITLACPQPEGTSFPGHGLLRYSNDYATGAMGVALVLDRLQRGGPDFNFTLDELLPENRHA